MSALVRRFGKGSGAAKPANDVCQSRLAAIGRAMDQTGTHMQDIALSIAGDDVFLVALILHSHLQRTGWSSVTYRVVEHVEIPAPRGLLGSFGTRGEQTDGAPAPGPWEVKLAALGALVDKEAPALVDLSLIDLNSGFYFNGIAPAADSERASRIVQRGFTAEELAAAVPLTIGQRPSNRRVEFMPLAGGTG